MCVTNVEMRILCKIFYDILFHMIRSLSLKCSENDCTKFFHPICMKESLSYYNLTAVDNLLYGVIFCEEHSKNFLINHLKTVLK